MRKLVALTLAVSAVGAVLLGITISIGQARPQPDRVRWLHLGECGLLCWGGIHPGQTTLNDAANQIREIGGDSTLSYPGREDVPTQYFTLPIVRPNTPTLYVNGHLLLRDAKVMRIDIPARTLIPERYLPSLAEVVSTFGTPTCVWPPIPRYNQQYVLVYEPTIGSAMSVYLSSATSFAWDQIVMMVTWTSGDQEMPQYCGGQKSRVGSQPWHGFASIRRYQRKS